MTDSLIKYKSPGMLLGIWVPGKGKWTKGRGLGNLKPMRKIGKRDKFRIGSLTKTFTVTVALQLIDEGKLKFDDRLSKYFPSVPGAKNVKIIQLMDMTSGLFNYTEDKRMQEEICEDRFREWEPEELIARSAIHKPYFYPGEGLHYSNTNTILLGLIIQQLTGNRLKDEIEHRVVQKLGLRHTYFPKHDEVNIRGDHIRGYFDYFEDGQLEDWTKQNVSWGWVAGAMVSNLYDLKRYVKALSDGTLLSKKLQEKRLNHWISYDSKHMPTLSYGLGIFTAGGFVGHNGGLPGYVSMAMYNPKTGARIVFILNTQPADGEATLKIFKEIIKIMYPEVKV